MGVLLSGIPGQTVLVLVHGPKDTADDRAVTESPETHVYVPCLYGHTYGMSHYR